MRFKADHDLHIHTRLSFCACDPEQNPENLLKYGEKNGFTTLCLTDHMWDSDHIPTNSDFYEKQNYAHICESLPLPESDNVRYLFGCETDLDLNMTLGISREIIDKLDFVIIPLNHFHMGDFTCEGGESPEELAKLVIKRFDGVLDMDLPFHKIGIAHFSDGCIGQRYVDALKLIPDSEYRRIFSRAAEKGIGIELNIEMNAMTGENGDAVLAPYRFAKEAGCKFYLGSDIHTTRRMGQVKERFETIIDLIGLTEDDKFIIGK